MNVTRSRAAVLAVVVSVVFSAISPALSETAAQQARESTGEANSQKQLGGQARDRKISQEMFRHSHNRMYGRYGHYHRHPGSYR